MGILDGKVVLVTSVRHFVGGAAARACAEESATVICHDDSFADAQAGTAFETENPGLAATGAQEPQALVDAIMDRYGRIDVLVSNDAFPAIRAPVEEASEEDMRAGLEALVVRPFAMAGAVAPAMKAAGQGRILFVTSAAPLRGLPNYGMYATARGAANSMTVSLARELAKSNILVNAIAPNYVESPTYFPDELLANPEALAKITRNIPLGRLGKPEEIGATIAFMASEKCGFMTGHVLPIAGGWA